MAVKLYGPVTSLVRSSIPALKARHTSGSSKDERYLCTTDYTISETMLTEEVHSVKCHLNRPSLMFSYMGLNRMRKIVSLSFVSQVYQLNPKAFL